MTSLARSFRTAKTSLSSFSVISPPFPFLPALGRQWILSSTLSFSLFPVGFSLFIVSSFWLFFGILVFPSRFVLVTRACEGIVLGLVWKEGGSQTFLFIGHLILFLRSIFMFFPFFCVFFFYFCLFSPIPYFQISIHVSPNRRPFKEKVCNGRT